MLVLMPFAQHTSLISHPPNRQLYDVLAHPVIQQNRIPILLACNKIDMGLKAHSVDFIRKRLEKELDQVWGGFEWEGMRRYWGRVAMGPEWHFGGCVGTGMVTGRLTGMDNVGTHPQGNNVSWTGRLGGGW